VLFLPFTGVAICQLTDTRYLREQLGVEVIRCLVLWAHTLLASQHHEGLVTFLVYPPDDLLLVVQIQWLGD
jgi:hypothetical protein